MVEINALQYLVGQFAKYGCTCLLLPLSLDRVLLYFMEVANCTL